MPFPLLPILGLAGSFFGGLGGEKSKQQSTSTTTPTISPQFKPLQDLLLQQAMRRLNGAPTDLTGYESQNIGNINKTFGLADMALQNRLRARGLSRSNIAGAGDARIETGRAGAIANFQSGLPLLQRQLANEDIGMAASLLPLGRGTTTTSTGKGSQGGGAAGGFEDFGTMLGYLIGLGAFGKKGA